VEDVGAVVAGGSVSRSDPDVEVVGSVEFWQAADRSDTASTTTTSIDLGI
jgi:hypothetical protein